MTGSVPDLASTDAGSDPAVFDVAIVGAGMVGASIAWNLVHPSQAEGSGTAPKVLWLEAESAPGYHTTGRSAALFAEGYGPPPIRALARASRAFFESPPEGFAPQALLSRRGAMFVGDASQREAAQALHTKLRADGLAVAWLDGPAACARVPVLRPEAVTQAVLDEGACDIDVDAMLQGFVRGARACGVLLAGSARVSALARQAADGHGAQVWRIGTADGRGFLARTLVNAAGAWVDEVAALAGVAPVGIEPRRRTAFRFDPPSGSHCAGWPAVVALDESWYIKPDAGLLLGSPANADLVTPHDVVAEEFDVALGIHQIEAATTLSIRRPRSAWAGLRCFVADGAPVLGPEPGNPSFFWAAALGGYGIQSAPAVGRLCARWLRGLPMPGDLQRSGLHLGEVVPDRLRAPAKAST